MNFLEELMQCDPHFFWNQVKNYSNLLSIYLGTLKINNEIENYQDFIPNLFDDLQNKISNDHLYLKLFHDIGNNGQTIIHYLIIVERDQIHNFKRSLLYAFSRLNNIDHSLLSHRKQVDHYLEYHDAYDYQRVNSYALAPNMAGPFVI